MSGQSSEHCRNFLSLSLERISRDEATACCGYVRYRKIERIHAGRALSWPGAALAGRRASVTGRSLFKGAAASQGVPPGRPFQTYQ